MGYIGEPDQIVEFDPIDEPAEEPLTEVPAEPVKVEVPV